MKLGRQGSHRRCHGFVKTSVAEAIYAICQYAVKRRRIAAFTLSPGNGKTMALRQIAEEIPGAVLITVRKTRSAPKSFLQAWSRALRLRESGRAEDLQDRLTARLAGSDRLTLVDECHKLGTNTLNLIREVFDETRTPFVLSGTPSFYQTLTSKRIHENASELMTQLFSRVGIFRNLDELAGAGSETGEPERLHTAEDIHKVFARQHVRLVRNGIDFLVNLANTPAAGGLRLCRDLVQLVIDLYPGESVTAEKLSKALVSKLGPREVGFRMDQASRVSAGDSARVAVG